MAERYAQAVMEAVDVRRRDAARLVDEMRVAATLPEVERIKAELTKVRDQYEAVLMSETIAMQARNQQRRMA